MTKKELKVIVARIFIDAMYKAGLKTRTINKVCSAFEKLWKETI